MSEALKSEYIDINNDNYVSIRNKMLSHVDTLANHLVLRMYDDNYHSRDVLATIVYPNEEEALKCVFKSAINVVMSYASTFKYPIYCEKTSSQIQTIKDMAEHMIDFLIPNCNGYDTVYCPLGNLFDYYLLANPNEHCKRALLRYGIKEEDL